MNRKKNVLPFGQPNPICQVMPKGRVRIDPTQVRQLYAWMQAATVYQRKVAGGDTIGIKGEERERKKGMIKWAKAFMQCVSHLNSAMLDTVSLYDFNAALDHWDSSSLRVQQYVADLCDTDSEPAQENTGEEGK